MQKLLLAAVAVVLLNTRPLKAQENELLNYTPSSKQDFINSEKLVINSINWLENTPVNQQQDRRKQVGAELIKWITDAPTVTIEVNSYILDFTKKNSDLLLIFMGGWTKYTLENDYTKDAVKCNAAGIRSVIKAYQMGNGLKKDKAVDKLIELEQKGELENWVKTKITVK